MGRVAELSRRWPALLKEARERGDLFAVTNLSTNLMAIIRLGADDADGARRHLQAAIDQWSQAGFHVQHHFAVLAQALIELYTGNGAAAWKHISEQWPAYQASFLLRWQIPRIDALFMHASSAVAAATSAADPGPLLRTAEGDAHRLRREKMPWADAVARLIQAQVAAARGQTASAELLAEAANLLDSVDMRMYAAAARRRLGQLIGGDRGRDLIKQADAWMTGQQVRNPARMAAIFAPGFRD
jgi:hypothetical protein